MDSKASQSVTLRDLQLKPPAENAQARHGIGGWVIGGLLLLALGVGAWFFFTHFAGNKPAADAQGGRFGGARETRVVAAAAKQGELPLYLYGLGTVTPFNLVTVRSRVGGQIINVAFKEGEDVKEGDLLVEIDPRPFQVQLEQAQGQQARDQALLNNAKADQARYESAGTSVAQQQIDTAASLVRQYQATVEADQAGINSARLQLTYCRITAPIGGRIGLRRVDIGNIVEANDPNGVAVITQLQPIAMVFSISQDDAVAVLRKPKGGIGLAVDAFDRAFVNLLATGSISALDNQIDQTTGTLRIKATFENKDEVLFPSQFVNARLHVETMKDATIVPAAAVQHGPDGEFLYVVKSDQTVEVRPAKIGPTTEDLTAIAEGIAPGEMVVTDGVDKLQPGSKVTFGEPGRRGPATQRGAATPPEGQAPSRRRT